MADNVALGPLNTANMQRTSSDKSLAIKQVEQAFEAASPARQRHFYRLRIEVLISGRPQASVDPTYEKLGPRRVVTVNQARVCQSCTIFFSTHQMAQNHAFVALPSGKPASIEIFQNLNGDVSADAGLIAKVFTDIVPFLLLSAMDWTIFATSNKRLGR